MGKILTRQAQLILKIARIARLCHNVIPFWRSAYLRTFFNALQICRDQGFKPDEAFRLGLFDPVISKNMNRFVVSKNKWTLLQMLLNPASAIVLTEDKSIFYLYCLALKVPIPKLYALFFQGRAGWSFNSPCLKSREDWVGFINSSLPEEFIVKPMTGSHSRGVYLIRRNNGRFVVTNESGQNHEIEDVLDIMTSKQQYDSFVMQERLENHPDLIRLTNTESLQTLRVITLIDKRGKCHILHAHLKPIIGPYLVDTFIDGLIGNVEAVINIEEGTLGPATQITGTGSGIRTIVMHPDTNLCFEGFKLPFWKKTCDLVTEVAPKFLPLRTIGWDIALTSEGPIIVEGNSLWDPPVQHGSVERLKMILTREAG